MKTDDIRQLYLDYFAERDHTIVPSAPLIPHDDPTLMFTSAGMVQFKPYYSGEIDPLPFARAASCQKCFRAGGKDSDLENVGKTLRHHTFFEMLGNFSFGDYFKREACAWALEFSRDVVKLDMSRVWVTYFEEDEETLRIWRDELGFPAERIVPLGAKQNFWGPAGDTGACGPCSEMHYDRGAEYGPDDRIGDDTDRFMEYWNMVFPQFDQQPDGSRPQLKNRGIDTGLGLARLALILQGATSNYTIDSMWPITRAVAEAAGVPDYRRADQRTQLAVNAIADHIRALTFVMSEGVAIGNTDRSYVLKRVLRRAARFGRRLGVDRPFIHTLVPVVIDTMGHIYPEIKEKPRFIADSIRADEENFHRTMSSGMELIEEELALLEKQGATVFPGDIAFRLWETYGFPKEDTMEVAADAGLEFDEPGYKQAATRHRAASTGVMAASGEAEAEFHRQLQENFSATEFIGYTSLQGAGQVLSIVKEFEFVGSADEAMGTVSLVLDVTPFYAESGGQVGDQGMIRTSTGAVAVSGTTKTKAGIYLHRGRVVEGYLQNGQTAKAMVDDTVRRQTERNHSATHLMQGALKRLLGAHVTQGGSLVNERGLRFDFTHLKAMTPAELRSVEELVNAQIRANAPVEIQWYDAPEANRLPGVIAPFDEKYGDRVRVVSMGRPDADDDPELTHWDVEFCGGTHVARTGDIGVFVIKGESSISQGVRRLEAMTGEAAETYLLLARDTYRSLAQTLSVDGAQVRDAVAKLADEKRELERQVKDLKRRLAMAGGGAADGGANGGGNSGGAGWSAEQLPGGIRLITQTFRDMAPDDLRVVSHEIAKSAGGERTAIVLASDNEGKAALLVSVTPDLVKSHPAGGIVRELAAVVGGGGGGKPDFAQAGGKDASKIPDALAKARELLG